MPRFKPFLPLAVLTFLALLAAPAHAEVQVNLYAGANENFDSEVHVQKGGVNDTRDVSWEGESFKTPPYYGGRITWWFEDNKPGWGVGLEYTHAKAYSNINFNADPVYDHLEFTDGMNLLTVNAMHRFMGWADNSIVPYVGIGAGLSLPHVEVKLDAFPAEKTWDYELTGIAAQALAGVEWRFAKRWTLFAEGKLTYSEIDATVNGGGHLETEIWSPHVAFGVSFRFGDVK